MKITYEPRSLFSYMCHSEFECACRLSVLNTLLNDIPARYSNAWRKPLNCTCFFDKKCDGTNGRPDIVLNLEYTGQTEKIVIECKSGLTDLKSGYGLNFCGDINYVIFPEDEYLQRGKINKNIILKHFKEKHILGVGILMLDKRRRIKGITSAWRMNCDPHWMAWMGLGTEFGDYY